jgi:hypothetical protein
MRRTYGVVVRCITYRRGLLRVWVEGAYQVVHWIASGQIAIGAFRTVLEGGERLWAGDQKQEAISQGR